MSSNIAEIATEAPLTSNPLGVIPGRNTIRCALWPPNITRPSPGGYASRSGRRQEAEFENERSR